MFSSRDSRAKQDSRRRELKHGLSAEEQRRKREEASNEIRKSKREEGLQKRRNVGAVEDSSSSANDENGVVPSLDLLPQCVQAVMSLDAKAHLEATIHIRKLLSIGSWSYLVHEA
jgi:hypothetical protein